MKKILLFALLAAWGTSCSDDETYGPAPDLAERIDISAAIADKINQLHRESMLTADTRQDENGRWIASVHYRDGDMPMMSLSLMAPNEEVGKAMAENMKRSIAQLYKTAMDCATGPARKKKEPAE